MTTSAVPSVKRRGKGRKAKTKAASGAAQGPIGNTGGVYVPVPKPNMAGGTTKIPIIAETEEEKSFLEKKQGQLQDKIDDWVAKQGDSKMAMGAGAIATAFNQVFFPTSIWELIPVGKAFKLAKKGKEAIEAIKKTEKAAEKTAEVAKKAPAAKKAEKAEEKVKETKSSKDNGGGWSEGDGGRCKLRTHKELTDKNSPHKCPKGMDSHHVIANRTFQTAAGRKGNLMKGGVPEESGMAICLETNKNGPKSEHVLAHKEYDKAEKLLAKDPSSPEGLAKLGQLEKKAGESIEKATNGKCKAEDIEKQLRDHHKGKFKLGKDVQVRASKNPNSLTQKALDAIGKVKRSTR